MIKSLKAKNILSLALCCLLLFTLPMMCSAAEISDQEVARLATIFNQLEINNNLQLSELETLKTSLMTNQQKLEGYQKALEESQRQLKLSSQELKKVLIDLNQAQTSLEKVNQSFKEYNKETQAEIRKQKEEKYVAYAGILYLLLNK